MHDAAWRGRIVNGYEEGAGQKKKKRGRVSKKRGKGKYFPMTHRQQSAPLLVQAVNKLHMWWW
jgi:hypothetical protein